MFGYLYVSKQLPNFISIEFIYVCRVCYVYVSFNVNDNERKCQNIKCNKMCSTHAKSKSKVIMTNIKNMYLIYDQISWCHGKNELNEKKKKKTDDDVNFPHPTKFGPI